MSISGGDGAVSGDSRGRARRRADRPFEWNSPPAGRLGFPAHTQNRHGFCSLLDDELHGTRSWHSSSRVHRGVDAGSEGRAQRFSRTPGDSGVLSRRLEPGLRRPDGALQRAARRVPRVRCASCWVFPSTASGVMSRSRTTANCRFPLLSDFEPKGQVARMYGAYRDAGRHERACAVRDRWRRRDSMELLFAGGRQSWRRRHPAARSKR